MFHLYLGVEIVTGTEIRKLHVSFQCQVLPFLIVTFTKRQVRSSGVYSTYTRKKLFTNRDVLVAVSPSLLLLQLHSAILILFNLCPYRQLFLQSPLLLRRFGFRHDAGTQVRPHRFSD